MHVVRDNMSSKYLEKNDSYVMVMISESSTNNGMNIDKVGMQRVEHVLINV